MSALYISSFKDADGTEKYGLFYNDDKGKTYPLKENWKDVSFDSEVEAQDKLNELAEERRREDKAEPFSIEEA